MGLVERLEDRSLLSVASITISDVNLTEGNSGTPLMVFTLTRTGDTSPAINVSYTTADNTAVAGSDYTATSNVVSFASGQTTATIEIPITGETLFEGDESFFVNLTGVSDAGGPAASFANKQDTSFGSAVRAVSVGDLNGDGKLDVAAVVPFSNKVFVFLNNTAPGSSTMTFGTKVGFDTGTKPYSVKIGDLNGDGKPDIATTNFGSHNVSVLLNTIPTGDTTPSFAAKQDLATRNNPYYVSLADINGDGSPDLVVANQGDGGVSVFLNQTTPGSATTTFSADFYFASDSAPAINPDCVTVGDLNGDGKPDLVVSNNYTSSIAVLLNTTAAGSSTPTFSDRQKFTFFNRNFSTALGDINADGKPDVVVVNRDNSTVSVLINTTPTGAASFSYDGRIDYATDGTPHSVSLADLNGDGLIDMALTGQNTVSVFINRTVPGTTTSNFDVRFDRPIGYSALHIVTGDMNGDGKPDLIDANVGSSTVSVFVNTFPSPSTSVALSAAQDSTTGSAAASVAVGDFNGDGKPDIAVPDPAHNAVSVLFNQSQPGAYESDFGAPQNFSTDSGPFAVAVGDFNGDGKPDIAVTSDTSNTVSVLFNTTIPGSSTANFSTSEEFATGAGPRSIAVGDLNGDGKLEIVVGNYSTNTISVFYNTTTPGAATPSFAPKQDFTAGTAPRSVVLGDLNGDGRLDIATANSGSSSASVLLNTTAPGDSTFSFSANQQYGVGAQPKSISIGDVNGDGRADLAVVSTTSNNVSVLFNNTNAGASLPAFLTKQDFALGTGAAPDSVRFGDFNGDGKTDLAVTSSGLNRISLLMNTTTLGTTTAAFATRQDFTAGTSPSGLAVRDLNGDGKLDFVLANGGTAGVSVVMHVTALLADSQGVGTILNDDVLPSAILDLNGSNGTGSGFAANYVENASPVNITDTDATITDATSTVLVSLKLVVSATPDGANDVLTVAGVTIPLNADLTSTGTVGGSTFQVAYVASTRTVTVTRNGGGTAPIGDFQTLLRGITYHNLSDAPNTTSRSISVIADDGANPSPTVTATVTVTAVNDAPTDITLPTATVAENLAAGAVVGTFSTTDIDSGNPFTYALVTGTGSTDNGSFTIVNGQLKTSAQFDFEAKSSYTIRVRSTDQGQLSFEKSFVVTVTDSNDPPSGLNLSANLIPENSATGTVVGTFSTVDPDSTNTFTYALVSGIGSTDNSSFTIVNDQLQTVGSFNFEAKTSYSIRVSTTDQNGLTFEKAFTLSVTNVNEAPTDISLSSSTIAENQPAGTVVGTLSSIDPDAGNTFTYALVSGTGSTDNASFAIVNGQVISSASFDFETKSTYSIRVQATDQGGLKFAKVFTIFVTDANDAPTDLSLSPTTVAENSAIGTAVGSFSTTDIDQGNTFTYTLVTGAGATDNSLFTIQGTTLKTNAILDFEAQSSYSIRVRTTDQGGLSFDQQFTITVTDANDAPTDLALSNSSIPEDTSAGTTVGAFTSTDAEGGTFSYSLVTGPGSTDNAAFEIVNGSLKTAVGFNFETKASYAIRVRTTDQGGMSFDKQFVIGITNVNEAPTDIALTPGTIQEGLPSGSGAGVLTTSDPDAGDTFTYALVAGTGSTDNSSFAIVDGQLTTTAVFDLETKNSYSIRLRSTDAAGLSVEKQLTITITNTNEAPTNIGLTSTSITENQPSGTVIGNFSSTDADAGNTFTYTLVAGEGDTDNSRFAIVNGQLRSNAIFDFETQSSYSIRVRTVDQGGQAFEKSIAIGVTNVNETPTGINLSASTVAENGTAGTVVGTFSSDDPDSGNTFTYTLVTGTGGADNASFAIVDNQLQTTGSVNFEAQNSYSIRVQTRDQNGLTFEKPFTISVNNVNEAPTDLALTNSTITEDAGIGSTIGTFSSSDPDADGSHLYSLVDGVGSTDNTSFTIVNGQLRTAVNLDFETQSTYFIRVRSTDQDGLSVEKQLTITVTNVNEAPTITNIDGQSIQEDSTTDVLSFLIGDAESVAGDLIVTVDSSNPDLIPLANITLSGADETRGIKVTPLANQNGTSTITIFVSDGINTSSMSFEVTVAAVNDGPTITGFASRTIQEDTSTGAIGFGIADKDVDSSELTVTATSSNTDVVPLANITFSGTGSDRSLAITPAANQSGVVTIIVTVSDGELTASKSFQLTVQAVDDQTVIMVTPEPLVYRISGRQIVAIDNAMQITDVDTAGAAFAGMGLRVSGHGSKDTVSILKQNGISTKGKNVLFGTTVIGTFSGGKKGVALAIDFNAAATQNAIQTVARSIGFKATGRSTGNRAIQFLMINPAGLNSIPATRQIQVTD